MERNFRELLKASFKSDDTEEWLDVYFTRPIGLVFALLWIKLGVTPNTITVLSMVLGAGAGFCFLHTPLWWNVAGVTLMMLANFCDSTDGQMARLTNNKTVLGRMLDGIASSVWYFFCYVALAIRIWTDPIPFTSVNWGVWGLLLCCLAGFYWHAHECQLADYYRQIHLYFLGNNPNCEFDSYEAQAKIFDSLPKRSLFGGRLKLFAKGTLLQHIFHFFYMTWCKKQEKNTPEFQRFFAKVKAKYPTAADVPDSLRTAFRSKSLPLMKYTNILTHNTRATVMYVAFLLNVPYVYPLFEITVLAALYLYMRHRHEKMCREMTV